MTEQPITTETSQPPSAWRLIQWVCLGVIILSLVICIAMAAVRSVGLTQVTVTALDQKAEPRDHILPFIKQNDALPDYMITVTTTDGRRINLGVKPNQSAVGGLTWRLPDPVSTAEVVSIRLDDKDKVVSDAIAEVQLAGETVTAGNYRFDFASQRSFSVGFQSFFTTPIGKGIVAAFTIAIVLIVFIVLGALVG